MALYAFLQTSPDLSQADHTFVSESALGKLGDHPPLGRRWATIPLLPSQFPHGSGLPPAHHEQEVLHAKNRKNAPKNLLIPVGLDLVPIHRPV